jgi:hypothetical protein
MAAIYFLGTTALHNAPEMSYYLSNASVITHIQHMRSIRNPENNSLLQMEQIKPANLIDFNH